LFFGEFSCCGLPTARCNKINGLPTNTNRSTQHGRNTADRDLFAKRGACKMASASSDYLPRGTVFALEQCGLLLRDARILCDAGSYASAVVLAAFAREELGRYRILRGLWQRTVAGESFSVKQIRKRCDDHVEKQREGMFSVVQRTDNTTVLGQLLQARSRAAPGSPEWKKADKELEKITQSQIKRTPEDRHKSRMKALYVEPVESGWNRPAETSEAAARDFLTDAINEYAIQQQAYVDPDLGDPVFHAALGQWHDRPELTPATLLHKFI
jgi:AbiV family abortive infection protein